MEKLAIDGGSRVRRRAFPGWPYHAPDEVEAAAAVLRSGKVNYWTGPEGRDFEKEFAAFTGARHAIALANGTAALELALYAFGIGPGDEVVTSCRTFIASASAAVMRGAKPVMADVDPVSQNITAETVSAALTSRTKAIIAVHLAGWPCEMEPLMKLARRRGIKVVEDCAQAAGAVYKGRAAGSLGDAAAFSFCQDKIVTTGGEGGMLTLGDTGLWKKAWAYKDHGKNYDSVLRPEGSGSFRWLHDSFGTNWRMTGMQAAIGRRQLKKLPGWVKTRQANAAKLNACFSGIPALRLTLPPEGIGHAYYKYYAFVRPEELKKGWDRDRLIAAINAEGIPCFGGSCGEIYLEKAFRGLRPAGRLPAARELGATSLMFLVHPTLGAREIEDTCRAVRKVFGRASRG